MGRQLLVWTVPLLSLGFIGCNGTEYSFAEQAPVSLSSGGNGGGDGVIGQPSRSCRNQLQTLTVPAKILFVVDVSGSNATEKNGIGTDKDKSYRKGSIQKFFDDYSPKSNFSWGFQTFAYSSATSYIGDTYFTPSMFTNSAGDMQSALNQFMSAEDAGDTPYVAAIRKASAAIDQDVRDGVTNAKYIVVFVSDGLPSPSVPSSTIHAEINALTGKAPGRVSFNTIYYGMPSQGGRDLMQGMANVGGGQFLDTNTAGTGRSFPIDNVIQIPGQVCDNG